jgi:quercetin dioxygenase-like cupin family protein
MAEYTFVPDVTSQADIPASGILSRTVYSDDVIKVIYFGFAPGEELSEHTASVPAIIHVLSGSARLTLGSDSFTAGPGTWVRMPARMPHSLLAETPTVMLLTMVKETAP